VCADRHDDVLGDQIERNDDVWRNGNWTRRKGADDDGRRKKRELEA
jgi:hypothetical protein